MEKFLRDYVKMYTESNGIKLTNASLTTIVNNLMEEDEIWDTLDSYITNYLD